MLKTTVAALALAILAFPALTTAPAQAGIEYPWCAHYSEPAGGTNCGFVTLTQCQAAISGIGGMCIENPAYPEVVAKQKRPRAPRN